MVGETPTNPWVFLLNMIILRCFWGDTIYLRKHPSPGYPDSPVTAGHRPPFDSIITDAHNASGRRGKNPGRFSSNGTPRPTIEINGCFNWMMNQIFI